MKEKEKAYHATTQKIFLDYSGTISSCKNPMGGTVPFLNVGGMACREGNELITTHWSDKALLEGSRVLAHPMLLNHMIRSLVIALGVYPNQMCSGKENIY